VISLSTPYDTWFSELLIGSFEAATGTELIPGDVADAGAAQWLYHAPFAVLAQDDAADPRFVYANLAAQRCFEYGWDEFTGLPSRLSAEEGNRDQRQAFMDTVLERGQVSGYRGLRVSKSGRRFWIEDTTVWNLADRDGALHGQAALVRHWSDA
jgi:PAS domain S-box-containing protein